MKPAPSLFRRRLKAKVQAQKNIRLEAARRLVVLGGTMPDLEDIRRVRADEGALPTSTAKGCVPGIFKGVFTISPDFDEPLPPDEMEMTS